MLHEMNPTSRFGSRVEAYRRYRPDYPVTLLELLLRNAGVVADVGAGTGISSLQLAEAGASVLAIEPNGPMREAGVRHPSIEWIDGTAEATSLPAASVDLVTCFQAFHWFDPVRSIREFVRILRPAGAIAAVWNERDSDDPFTAAYGDLVRRISGNHPAESRTETAAALHESPLLGPVETHEFPHGQQLDRQGLHGRAASTSYLPSEGAGFEELTRELDLLFDRYAEGGRVVLAYRTRLHLARPR